MPHRPRACGAIFFSADTQDPGSFWRSHLRGIFHRACKEKPRHWAAASAPRTPKRLTMRMPCRCNELALRCSAILLKTLARLFLPMGFETGGTPASAAEFPKSSPSFPKYLPRLLAKPVPMEHACRCLPPRFQRVVKKGGMPRSNLRLGFASGVRRFRFAFAYAFP
jgi:hypothetical protein